ncbi:GIY-YIG nuclease family protein [Kushneria indalinina]|uniref:Putative endonuclease n=1 Tax=Kushneria indalinina DSM 14324 TaxID=1122140 RepID=A0A3D9E2G1_9GAMM|nr:GIY-YIG nuclease family protein [Kushneria indalinina]REC96624.1 putative endonuclease [Kushneria indalinina DSM 14324]
MACQADHQADAEPASAVWSLYIIENRLGHLYTGVTTNVARRFNEHQQDGARCARSLRGKGPLRLRFSCPVGDKSRALSLERRIKKLSRHQRLAIIENGRLPLE